MTDTGLSPEERLEGLSSYLWDISKKLAGKGRYRLATQSAVDEIQWSIDSSEKIPRGSSGPETVDVKPGGARGVV